MTKEEIEGQIDWFESLLASIKKGDTKSAIEVIEAAIRMLEKEWEFKA